MKSAKNLLVTCVVGAVLWTGQAMAGPPVSVTFKNVSGTETANYKIVGDSENTTYLNASPRPDPIVVPQGGSIFKVQRIISPDTNSAIFRYVMGGKTCVFGTTFIRLNGIPKWTKTATPSGGATCTAAITYFNSSTYEWSAEFTMK
jgi:hypothetical protein